MKAITISFGLLTALLFSTAASAQPAAAPASPGSTLGAPAAAGPEDGAYAVRLRSLERSVNELKEQVFLTKAKLNILKETVLGGAIGASRCLIRHKNEMSGTFRLVKATYALDGVQIFSKSDDSGRLADMKEFDVYNGAIQPGSHTVSVVLEYQGHGYGVFAYMKQMKWTVKASHTFVAGDGKATSLTVVGFEKGGAATDYNEKAAIDFRVSVVSPGGTGDAAKPAAK